MKVKDLKEQLNYMGDNSEVYISNLICKRDAPEEFSLYIHGAMGGKEKNKLDPEVSISINVTNWFESYDDIHDGELVKLIQDYIKQKYPGIEVGYSS